MEKECITEDEKYHMCDQPDMYREIGDVIDALLDEFRDREMNNDDGITRS